jgi:hypothetical protein
MGTRHLTCVFMDNEYKVAQYGQWDGYPTGAGEDIIKFLENCDLIKFRDKLTKVRFTNDKDQEEVDKFLVSIGAKNGWMDMEQSKEFQKRYYHLSRDRGSEILDIIYKTRKKLALDNIIEFAYDGLFCEWVYVINLDDNTLEIYKGCNKEPLSKDERFYNGDKPNEDGYYPARLFKKYPLDKLPDQYELKRIEEEIYEK